MTTKRMAGIPPAPLSQGVLSFVTEEERSDSVQAFTFRIGHPRSRGAPRQSRPPTTQITISIEQLSLPLMLRADSEVFRTDPLSEDDHHGDLRPTLEDEREKQADIEWIADRANLFVGWFLERNFEMLSSVGNPMEKASILEWIFAPDHDGEVLLPDGRTWVPLHTERLPFSFQWCCKAVGMSRERFHDALLDALSEARERVSARHKHKFAVLLDTAKELST